MIRKSIFVFAVFLMGLCLAFVFTGCGTISASIKATKMVGGAVLDDAQSAVDGMQRRGAVVVEREEYDYDQEIR